MNLVSIPVVLLSLLLLSGSARHVDTSGLGETSAVQATEFCSERSDSAVATFEDRNLEAAIRSALSVNAADDLTCGSVSGLTDLVAREAEIASLGGIQNLTGLQSLDLRDNAISDISALGGLEHLTDLGLAKNSISDIGVIAELTDLTRLRIRENSISDITALRGLAQLTDLDITHNAISDISALSGLTLLTTLRVYNNPITDIGAMRGLINLSELHVHDLPDLATIRPLVENTGLGKGDRVILMRSNVPCSDVRLLKNKGVSVGGCEIEALIHWWWAVLLGMGLIVFTGVLVRRRNERRWAAWMAEAKSTSDQL